MSEEFTVERVQELVARAPYHQWLGIEVASPCMTMAVELTAKWREEWVVDPDRRYTHGGVLAALVDLGGRLGDGDANSDAGCRPSICASIITAPPCRAILRCAAGWSGSAASSRLPTRSLFDQGRQASRQRPRHLFHRAAQELTSWFQRSVPRGSFRVLARN